MATYYDDSGTEITYEQWKANKEKKEVENKEVKDTKTEDTYKGNRKLAKKTWEFLTKKQTVNQPFDVWLKGINKNTSGQAKVHSYLLDQGVIDQDFTTWRNGFIGNEALTEKEAGPTFLVNGETLDINGVPVNIQGNATREVAANFEGELKNIQAKVDNLRENPLQNSETKKADIIATNAAIKEIQANTPSMLEAREDIDDLVGWEQLNEAERRRYKELLTEMEANPNAAEPKYDNRGKLIPQISPGDDREKKSDLQKRIIIYNKIIEERKQKLEQYNNGEIELSSRELSEIFKPTEGFRDYLETFAPKDLDYSKGDVDVIEDIYMPTINKAIEADPRFKSIQQDIINNIQKQSQSKMAEIANSFVDSNNPTQAEIEKAQNEFTDWYNKEYQTQIKNNKVAGNLYQEYGVAADDFFKDQDFISKRRNDTTGLMDYIDSLKAPYLDEKTGRKKQGTEPDWKYATGQLLEATLKHIVDINDKDKDGFDFSDIGLGSGLKTTKNQIEIGVNQLSLAARKKIVDELEKGFKDGTLNRDMTVGEAREILGEDSQIEDRLEFFGADSLRFNNRLNLGTYYDEKQKRYTNMEQAVAADIKSLIYGEKRGTMFNEAEIEGKFIGDNTLTLTGFISRAAQGIEQFQNFLPSIISTGLYAGSAGLLLTPEPTASTKILAASLFKAGVTVSAIGALIEGTQAYGSTFMGGLKKQMDEEYGEGGYSATEYLEALKDPKYRQNASPLLTGLGVTGVSFGVDLIAGKIGGAAATSVASSTIGKKMMANTFTKFLLTKAIPPLITLKAAPYQEYLEEGFQSYIEQVGENFIAKPGEKIDSPFTKNIDWDQVQKEADMGFAMGELFGLGGLNSSFKSGQSYIGQAQKIAANIDMSPNSPTFNSGNKAFEDLLNKIKNDQNLNPIEKATQVQQLSDIRKAAIKAPSDLSDSDRAQLTSLLKEKYSLDRVIKQVDDTDISAQDIARRKKVSLQIQQLMQDRKKPPPPGAAGATAIDPNTQRVGPKKGGGYEILDYSSPDYVVAPENMQDVVNAEAVLNKVDNDSYSKTNKLLADEDFDIENSLDQRRVIQEAGGILEATTKRLWRQGSLLTRDQFKKALETEYLQSLMEYDADRDLGDNAGKSISNKFNLRAGKIARENLGKGEAASLDSEQARQVADTTEQKDFDEVQTEESKQREKVYASQTSQIANLDTAETKAIIKDEVSKDILLDTSKGINAADSSKNITNQSKKEYFKRLRKDIGTFSSQKYKDFVNSLDAKFIKSLPVATIKRRFGKLFGIKQTGTTKTKQISKTGKPSYFNKPVFSVPKITAESLQAFKDYFLGGEKRQQSLYNILATDFALESMQELIADKDFMGKLQTALGNDGITALEFMQNIENKLDARVKEDSSLDVVDKKTRKKSTVQDLTKSNVTVKSPVKKAANNETVVVKPKKQLSKKYLNIANEKDSRDKTTGVVIKTIQVQKGTRTDKDGNIIKQGTNKKYGVFDEGALLQEDVAINKTETQGQGRNRIANNFISQFPQYRDMIKRATSGGITLSMFQTSQEFDNQINKPKSRQEVSKRNPYNSANRLTKAFIDLVTNNKSKFKADQLQNLKAYIDYWKSVAKYLQANPNDAWFFGRAIADAAAGGQGGFLRYSALVGFYATNRKGFADFLSKVVEEHGYPQADLNESMLAAAIDNNMEDMSKIAEQAFLQGSLLDTDDTLVNKLYSTNQTQGFYDITSKLIIENKLDWLPPGLAAWGRFAASGINPNLYKSTFNGKSIADIFGVGVVFDLNNSKNTIAAQNKAIIAILTGTSRADAVAQFKSDMKPVAAKEAAALVIQETASTILEKKCNSPCKVPMTTKELKTTLNNSLDTHVNAQKTSKATKGISVFDFDDTLATTNSQVIVNMPDGSISKIDASEFATQSVNLENAGATFNFDEFNKVVNGKKGPLADLALKRQNKFGSGDIFVLTARPQASAQGIKTFLDGIGLNLPIENITGLENGSPQAKAQWILSKTADGYNDFYFADDAIKNVKAVKEILDQIDVKSRVQQAIVNKVDRLNTEFNKQIEDVTGKESFKTYSKSRATLEGTQKDKGLINWLGNQLTLTASAEDFMGLMYDLIGKGKEGSRHKKWILDNLVNPYNKAEKALLSAKVSVAKDFAALRDKFPSLKTKTFGSNPLLESIGVGPYTKSQAMRVYMWTKQGMSIPGLSQRDQNALVAAVEANPELRAFADQVILIQKDQQYPAPGNSWVSGNISSDIMSSLDKGFRRKLMTEFDENIDIIFSEDNMNKLEALYGSKWVEALKDSLRRMKSGSNRPVYQGGGSRVVNELLDWLNGSVGAIMFLNMRSGLLQLTSAVNFINWGDNNIYAASKAFANQKQYWKDVIRLMNSDYLVNRRDGLKINVNEAELVDAGKKGGMKGALAYFLDKGFLITRIMDSLAIGTGGATFFRNRVDALLKRINPATNKTYTLVEAETKAFEDFYAIAEESQQSSNPSKISQQQASLAGRVILSFQNTTMQYMRMNKKAVRDLYNRRKNPGQTQRESDLGNISKIMYYTTIQNVIFHSLQQALFAGLFQGGEEGEEEDNKTASIANGMLDSLLFGLGFGGAAISTVKNVVLELAKQGEKKAPKYEEAVWSVFDFSPVLDSKVRKLRSGFKSLSWNMDEMKRRGWSLDNPAYLAIAQIVAAGTNAPLDRVLRKIMNIRAALDEETRVWQKVSLMMGWDTWSVGLPYWGLQSTIRKEEAEDEKIKANFKADVRKLKADGYKKTMTPEKFDNVVEMKSPYGTVMYYYKIIKNK